MKLGFDGSEMAQSGINWEEVLVNNFLTERIRDRSLFELRSQKKRKDFFSKMCHDYEDRLIRDYMIKLPSFHGNEEIITIKKILAQNGAKKNCYVMSYCERDDGKVVPIEDGIQVCRTCLMSNFLICTEDLVFFQGEFEGSYPPRFILYRGDRKKVEQSLAQHYASDHSPHRLR
jgi:hypothetical protein